MNLQHRAEIGDGYQQNQVGANLATVMFALATGIKKLVGK